MVVVKVAVLYQELHMGNNFKDHLFSIPSWLNCKILVISFISACHEGKRIEKSCELEWNNYFVINILPSHYLSSHPNKNSWIRHCTLVVSFWFLFRYWMLVSLLSLLSLFIFSSVLLLSFLSIKSISVCSWRSSLENCPNLPH